jgi:type 1 fimbria pilin
MVAKGIGGFFRGIWFRMVACGLLGLLMAMPAMASCTGVRAGGNVTLPSNLTLPRNPAVGQIVWDSNWVPVPSIITTCTSSADMRVDGYTRALNPVGGSSDIYDSGIPGIGIKSATFFGGPAPANIDSGIMMRWPQGSVNTGAGSFDSQGFVRVQLIVTGPVSSGTTNLVNALGGSTYNGSTGGMSIQLANGKASKVTATACTIQNPSLDVTVPEVRARDFNAVGSTAGGASFSLSLSCPAGMSVGMTLTDVTDPGNRTTNLTLSSDSSAKGLAYQIMQGSHVVAFGPDSGDPGTENQFSVNSSTSPGVLTIPFTVQYVKTGDIAPGTVNGKATFTMSYQ